MESTFRRSLEADTRWWMGGLADVRFESDIKSISITIDPQTPDGINYYHQVDFHSKENDSGENDSFKNGVFKIPQTKITHLIVIIQSSR